MSYVINFLIFFHFIFYCMLLYGKLFQFCIFSPKNLDISELLHIFAFYDEDD